MRSAVARGSTFKNVAPISLATCRASTNSSSSSTPLSRTRARSYAHGACSTPLLSYSVGSALKAAVDNYASNDALVSVHQKVRWSYAELDRRVDGLASGLLSLGLVKGDRVGIWSPNNAEWVLTQFATARLGLVLVNINPSYRPNELRHALNLVGCKAIVMPQGVKSSDFVQILSDVIPEFLTSKAGQLHSQAVPTLKDVVFIDTHDVARGALSSMHSFASLSEGPASKAFNRSAIDGAASRVHFDDPVNIQFTSGTTGRPKGATLTHHNIVNNGFFVGEAIRMQNEDRVCIPVPLYHCFGMVMGNLACVTHGATIVYPHATFDPERVLSAVESGRCSVLYGVPSMFIAELSHPKFDQFKLSTLRAGIMAGSLCPMEIMRQVTERMNMKDLTNAYGMTETSPVSVQSSTTDSLAHRVSTVGRVQPHIEICIRTTTAVGVSIVPRGDVGELCTRGYSVMRGYWGDDAKTKESIDAAGWMQTGDLATMDDDGYVRIVGRLKDMIIRGGENIYPKEIEEVLHTHPDIDEAHVFGVPDERFGESVAVWVRCKSSGEAKRSITLEDLQAFLKPQLAHFKVPVHLRVVETFPMTVSGKAQKFIMRDEMVASLKKVG